MPSRAEAIRIQRQQDAMMRQIEVPFQRKVQREKNRYLSALISSYTRTSMIDMPGLLTEHQRNIEKLFDTYARRAIRKFAFHTYRQSKAGLYTLSVKEYPEEFFDIWEATWLKQEGFKQAKRVAQTTHDDVRQALLTANQNQETVRQTVKRLQAVKLINGFRAETIARTETHNAAMFASKETAVEIEKFTETELLKFWCSAEDERTREWHLAMDPDEGIRLSEEFIVDGEAMDRPGDPSASSENVINCRCCITFGDGS